MHRMLVRHALSKAYLAIMKDSLLCFDAWIPLVLLISHVLCASHPWLHSILCHQSKN